MKNVFFTLALFSALIISMVTFAGSAHADEVKMVGNISKIELASDGKSATAVLKDTKSSESVQIIITDDLTLEKLKDKRIVEGDEIRCKFEKVDGKNQSKIFKKTAGC